MNFKCDADEKNYSNTMPFKKPDMQGAQILNQEALSLCRG